MPDEQLSWQIGDVRIARVAESILPIPAERLVPGITDDHLDQTSEWIGPFFDYKERMRLSIHTFVVTSGETTIVVDTCVGSGSERALPGDEEFIDRLDAAIDGGLDAVDVVLCTHLHFDHIGWNTRQIADEWVPTFANARYLMSRTEVDQLDGDAHVNRDDPSLGPLLDAGLVDLIDSDHSITPNVRTVPTPGHTPGHVSVLIESGGQHALITGDAFHTPLQIAFPELAATPFDADSEQSTATRRRVIADHIDGETLILGTHFAPPTAGRIRAHSTNDSAWFDTAD